CLYYFTLALLLSTIYPYTTLFRSKAEFEGELSIIPEETVSADANNTWSITDENIDEGYNYADEGNYSNTKQTNIRQTAYIETNSEEPVYLDLSVEADEDKRYKVGVGDYSEEFT